MGGIIMLPCWLSLLGKPTNTPVPGSGFLRVTEMPSVPLPLTPLPGNPLGCSYPCQSLRIYSIRLSCQILSEPFKIIFNGQNRNRVPFIHFKCHTLSGWARILFYCKILRIGIYSIRLTIQMVSEPFTNFYFGPNCSDF